MDADFLLERAADLAVLGIHLHDFDIVGGTATSSSAEACIVLVLPPQHVQEQTVPAVPRNADVLVGELAGTSRLAYAVAPGTVVTLTGEGVLGACTTLRAGGSGPLDTSIELPSRLALGPLAAVSQHPATPLTSAAVAGVWLARLSSRGSGPLALRALDPQLAGTADGVPDPSLSADQRAKVAAQATDAVPIRATRLEVTTRGGNLTADGEWDGISWSHRVTGGRDQYVRLDERVLLYPFGFHAVLTTLTERDPDVSGVLPGGPAALRRTVTLRIGDPVHATGDGSAMSRTFPFDRVEVTRPLFEGLGTPEPSYVHTRVTPDTQALVDESRALTDDAAAQRAVWGPYVDWQVRDYEDLRRRGDGRVDQLYAAWAEQSAAAGDLGWLADEDAAYAAAADRAAAIDDQISHLQGGFEGPDGPDPSVSAQIAELNQQASAFWDEARAHSVPFETGERIRARARAADAVVASLVDNLAGSLGQPRDVWDAVYYDLDPAISSAAQTWLDEQDRIADLDRQVREITALQHSETITAWPTSAAGGRLQFPVRLSRGEQVVDVRMPMMLVYDYSVPDAPEFGLPAYHSLDDPDLPAALDLAWAGSELQGVLPAGGSQIDVGWVRLDVVGAAAPKPSDVHVVRTLNLVGGLGIGDALFTPSLGRAASEGSRGRWAMHVDLPEVQALTGLSAEDSSAWVSFSADYLEHGDAAQVLFDIDGDVEVDFTHASNRSGGLAALQLVADGISRDHGPVQVAGLLADPDPAALLGDAATLLGFKLHDLLALTPDLKPPTMVSEVVEGGPPRIRMEWRAGPLGDLLAFRPSADSHVSLTVLAQVDGTLIDCAVGAFALQFPFDGDPLVRLDFGGLRFHQQTTYGVDVTPGVGLGSSPGVSLDPTGQVTTHPPTLDIDFRSIDFLGPLQLLETLQDAVDLAGNVPGIRATPTGVTASYAVPVPPVSCGVFSLSNLSFHSEVDVPFDQRPVTVSIGFASRDKPFSLSVLSFAGGGYVDVRIDADGPAIEASLEFGAQLSVDFVVATGEVHALGGVQYNQDGNHVGITGYLRIGGSLEILSVVSVSVELRIALAYDITPRPRLVGRATLVLEIDLTLWSDKVEIDSGEWVLQGGGSDGPEIEAALEQPGGVLDDPPTAFAALDEPVTDEELARWQAYRASFTGGAR
ncbi:hypothetical protein ACVW00_003300 [Marmoricola sp. URHA0025 HA25]